MSCLRSLVHAMFRAVTGFGLTVLYFKLAYDELNMSHSGVDRKRRLRENRDDMNL